METSVTERLQFSASNLFPTMRFKKVYQSTPNGLKHSPKHFLEEQFRPWNCTSDPSHSSASNPALSVIQKSVTTNRYQSTPNGLKQAPKRFLECCYFKMHCHSSRVDKSVSVLFLFFLTPSTHWDFGMWSVTDSSSSVRICWAHLEASKEKWMLSCHLLSVR